MSPKKRPWSIVLDHAAVATREPEKLKRVLAILGLDDAGSEAVASQGVVTHFLRPAASEPAVEILEVTDPLGVVGKYLDKKGAGIHHLSFMVSDLDALTAELRAQGVRLTYDTAKPGAHRTRVNFIHPESTGGILIEVSEKAL
ncbi:MAG: VOC family protein [Deltaproteobacteria bacterium]|nr:VOC family protein [Deltaproteobacteria bacterium]